MNIFNNINLFRLISKMNINTIINLIYIIIKSKY